MMKYLQKLGKALMLPVACLPICGILMGIGYALCPATMQGGDIAGAKALIGFFLVKAGGALIDKIWHGCLSSASALVWQTTMTVPRHLRRWHPG